MARQGQGYLSKRSNDVQIAAQRIFDLEDEADGWLLPIFGVANTVTSHKRFAEVAVRKGPSYTMEQMDGTPPPVEFDLVNETIDVDSEMKVQEMAQSIAVSLTPRGKSSTLLVGVSDYSENSQTKVNWSSSDRNEDEDDAFKSPQTLCEAKLALLATEEEVHSLRVYMTDLIRRVHEMDDNILSYKNELQILTQERDSFAEHIQVLSRHRPVANSNGKGDSGNPTQISSRGDASQRLKEHTQDVECNTAMKDVFEALLRHKFPGGHAASLSSQEAMPSDADLALNGSLNSPIFRRFFELMEQNEENQLRIQKLEGEKENLRRMMSPSGMETKRRYNQLVGHPAKVFSTVSAKASDGYWGATFSPSLSPSPSPLPVVVESRNKDTVPCASIDHSSASFLSELCEVEKRFTLFEARLNQFSFMVPG